MCGAGIKYKGENVIDNDGGTFPWTCPGCGASSNEGYIASRKEDGWVREQLVQMPVEPTMG